MVVQSDSSDHASEEARRLFQSGVEASTQGDARNAAALFAQACAFAPGWALAHFLLGSELASLGEFERAEASLAAAVLCDPQLRIARYQLGFLQFTSGRPAASLVSWQPLVTGGDEDGLASSVRGFDALASDRLEEAMAAFGSALACPALNPGVAADIRRVLEKLGSTGTPARTPEVAPAHVLLANYDQYKLH